MTSLATYDGRAIRGLAGRGRPTTTDRDRRKTRASAADRAVGFLLSKGIPRRLRENIST